MESLKVSFSFLKMESQREGGHKKKRARERQDGGNIWRNKTSAKLCDNMKGLESLLRETWTHSHTVKHMGIHVYIEVDDTMIRLANGDEQSLWPMDFILANFKLPEEKCLFIYASSVFQVLNVLQDLCTSLILPPCRQLQCVGNMVLHSLPRPAQCSTQFTCCALLWPFKETSCGYMFCLKAL